MGLGHLPWFKIDRTGAALLGAMLLIVCESISPTAAWQSIDVHTVGLLFGLMVVSAAFKVGGFYAWAAKKVGSLQVSPSLLLAILIAVSAILSSLLTNDVVVLAMTPVLCSIALARQLNPVPFLLGFCFAANIGSVATIIGSPQNMIIAQALSISFNAFFMATVLPTLASLFAIWAILSFMYRNRWELPGRSDTTEQITLDSTPFNSTETLKACLITLALVLGFVLTDIPHMLIALAAASILLLNRKIASKDMLVHVDGNLMLLLMGLFVVNAAFAATGMPEQILAFLKSTGIDLYAPIPMLLISGVLSDVVGNSPAVMLLEPFLHATEHNNHFAAAIALGTGFSSNVFVFGSLAGIIVVEQAAKQGVNISFTEFLKTGFPVTIISMLLAIGWIFLII